DQTDHKNWIKAWLVNALKEELQACLTELGTNPKGSYDDVKARLDAMASFLRIELDYMEYPSDALAQAAYVDDSSDEYGGRIQSLDATFAAGYTAMNEDTAYRIGKAGTIRVVKYYTTSAGVSIKAKVFRVNGSNYDFVGESEVFATVSGGATRVLTTPIPGVESGDIIGFYTASNLLLAITVTTGSGYSYLVGDITGTTAISTWAYQSAGEAAFSCIITDLQCFSEDTIKEQGNYSLKGIAAITGSLNATLTRTVSPTINLSGINTIKFHLRATVGGAR
ncbi:unnamed protein product, partial [marine sediment metagenome]